MTRLYIYASHPNQLNDSVDCFPYLLDFSGTSEKELKAIYVSFYDQVLASCGKNLNLLRQTTSEYFALFMGRKFGVVSLSQDNVNVSLWNNYTDSKGYCVELDVNDFPFKNYGPFPIHYVNELNPVKIDRNLGVAFLIQTNVKTEDWKEEKEWRMLVANPEGLDFSSYESDGSYSQRFGSPDEHDRKMKYPLQAVKSITLGERFFRASNIKCYPISDGEQEVVFLDEKERLRCKLLDFVQGKTFKLFMLENNLGTLSAYPVQIVKLQNRVYRIIK